MVEMEVDQPDQATTTTSPNSDAKKRKSGKQPAGGKPTGKFHCASCNVYCPNEATLEQHNQGKKHQQAVTSRQKRDRHTEASVFVGNLPKLNKITAVISEPGGENEKLKCDLITLFSEFGDVQKVIIDKVHGSYCILEFKSPTSAQKAIMAQQEGRLAPFYGKKLQVKSRNANTKKAPLRSPCSELSVGNVVELLKEEREEPLTALNMLDAAIKLPDNTARVQKEALKSLQGHINNAFPFHAVSMELFGSTVTGLALKDSDMDITLSARTRLERDDLVKVLKERCPGVSHVHLVPAPGQSTILRFKLDTYSCDLVFANKLGVRNSALISTIIKWDVKLARLLRLTTFWCKTVLGKKFARRPSSYAVTVMTLAYLRSCSLIPDFFNPAHYTEETRIYDLDCSFVTQPPSNIFLPTKVSVPELLAGFWRYYGLDFNRDDLVVSMKGALKKSDLVEGEERSDCSYVTVFRRSPLEVQDPLVSTHNLTHNVPLECVVMFGDYCRDAWDNWGKKRPLYLWMFGRQKKEEEGGETEEVQEEEEGSKTPEYTESGKRKRSLEAMEH